MLVVDDDEAVADVYASQLSESYDVSTAYDGESALEQVTADVDVVLLDRRMHGLSGREVLERIRGRDIDCGVVMVTAVDPGFDIVDMGFDDYLLKPVEGAQLQSVVAEAVNRLDKRAVVREYHALSAKVATLRVEKNPAELESSEEYQRLRARLEDLEARIEDGADAESDG
ncbi:response regulator receiver protein [Halosimplex carlsbadense 2-9-1]|uniref:Response regulator receiver protein n=1 Tax=Halosimplex carlsbadense 2-9-1 TaxID=797114 RepID=M0CLX0_9EURY|nr:response regulator receiver protein [Halosimplex carlsbadense 2-9-1]